MKNLSSNKQLLDSSMVDTGKKREKKIEKRLEKKTEKIEKRTPEWAVDEEFQKSYADLLPLFPKLDIYNLKYAKCRLEGNSRLESYKMSYGIEGKNEAEIQTALEGLSKSETVNAVINRMKSNCLKKAENQIQWHFNDSLNSLKFLVDEATAEINEAKQEGKSSRLTMTRVTAIKDAVKEINSMLGYTSNVTNIANSVTIIGNEADLPG